MKDSYREIQNNLRQQTISNAYLIDQKCAKSNPYNNQMKRKDSSIQTHCFKLIGVLSFFFIFTCYLYGGQDIKAGFHKFYHDLTYEIKQLEHQSPVIKETIGVCKRGYHYLRSKTEAIQNEKE